MGCNTGLGSSESREQRGTVVQRRASPTARQARDVGARGCRLGNQCPDEGRRQRRVAQPLRSRIRRSVMTSTGTRTASFTITDARYIGAKVGTDLRLLNNLYGRPPLADIDAYTEEVALLLRDGY